MKRRDGILLCPREYFPTQRNGTGKGYVTYRPQPTAAFLLAGWWVPLHFPNTLRMKNALNPAPSGLTSRSYLLCSHLLFVAPSRNRPRLPAKRKCGLFYSAHLSSRQISTSSSTSAYPPRPPPRPAVLLTETTADEFAPADSLYTRRPIRPLRSFATTASSLGCPCITSFLPTLPPWVHSFLRPRHCIADSALSYSAAA